MIPPQPVFERLEAYHDVTNFSCGKPSLDRYLQHSAKRDRHASIASVFVLAIGAEVIGYYTLHQHRIRAGEMPEGIKKRLSKYEVYPATLIGRFAVDRKYHKQGFGRDILYEALRKALSAAKDVASLAVVTEAIDADAQNFYEHHGFTMLNAEKRRLWMPMKTVEKLLSAIG